MKNIEEVVRYIEKRVEELEFLVADATELDFKEAVSCCRTGQYELIRLLRTIRKGQEEQKTKPLGIRYPDKPPVRG